MHNIIWYVCRNRDAKVISKHESIEEANRKMVELNTLAKANENFAIANDDYEKLYAIKEFHVFGIGRHRDEFRHSEIIEARTRLGARDIFEKRNPELRAVADYDLTVK